MRLFGRVAAGILLAIAVAVTVAVVVSESGSETDEIGRAAPASVELRGCRERVEGGELSPVKRRDTVIGPLAFLGLPGEYRNNRSRSEPIPGVGMPGIKIIALLRAGARVTVVVPREQRRWMKLLYQQARRNGVYAITLQACRRHAAQTAPSRECGWSPYITCRWRYTQFNGGFGLDFANAPQRGRCAALIIRVKGSQRPRRARLFRPAPSQCPRRAAA